MQWPFGDWLPQPLPTTDSLPDTARADVLLKLFRRRDSCGECGSRCGDDATCKRSTAGKAPRRITPARPFATATPDVPDLQLMTSELALYANPPIQPTAPQQQEMPLAVVHGQQVLQIPQDLYIPPDALEVILDAFEGPLDLLLYLIRRQNLDILDIPVAEITRQYVDYINVMQELRFELAAEYLVMAAILAEIKSRMLLPRPPAQESRKPIRVPSWYAACRSTNASSRPPRTSMHCRGRTATPRRCRRTCPTAPR